MIATFITYTCDVAGCESTFETKDMMVAFATVPMGWAELNWTRAAPPDGADPRIRAQRALKKMIAHAPPEVGEYQKAAFELMGGEALSPRFIPCKALICDKCLDKVGLGDFQTPDDFLPRQPAL